MASHEGWLVAMKVHHVPALLPPPPDCQGVDKVPGTELLYEHEMQAAKEREERIAARSESRSARSAKAKAAEEDDSDYEWDVSDKGSGACAAAVPGLPVVPKRMWQRKLLYNRTKGGGGIIVGVGWRPP